MRLKSVNPLVPILTLLVHLTQSVIGYQISFIFSRSNRVFVEYQDQTPFPLDQEKYCLFNQDCDSSNNEVCRDDKCSCIKYFQRDLDGRCFPCPSEGESCDDCCLGPSLTCFSGKCVKCHVDPKSEECVSQEAFVYMTLSQVALATAMIFGILALITLTYRILTNPLYMFGRSNANFSATSRTTFSRASISSMQRAIFWRMRDRPPCYGSEPAREQPHITTNTYIPGEPPPLYDGTNDIEPIRDLPPAYSVAVITVPNTDAERSTMTVINTMANYTEVQKDVESKEESASEKKNSDNESNDK